MYRSERTERNRQHKLLQRILAIYATVGYIFAIVFFILAFGYVGEQDRQHELLMQGYSLEEARK